MSFTCHLHVISMSFTFHLHVIYIPFTCHLHSIYMSFAFHWYTSPHGGFRKSGCPKIIPTRTIQLSRATPLDGPHSPCRSKACALPSVWPKAIALLGEMRGGKPGQEDGWNAGAVLIRQRYGDFSTKHGDFSNKHGEFHQETWSSKQTWSFNFRSKMLISQRMGDLASQNHQE